MKLWDRKTPWKAKGAGWAFPHLCSSPGARGKSLVLLALRCWPSASPWQQQALGFPAHFQEQRQHWLCVWANYLGDSRTAEIEALALYIFIKIISYIGALKLGKSKTWNADHGALGIDFLFFPHLFRFIEKISDPTVLELLRGQLGQSFGTAAGAKQGRITNRARGKWNLRRVRRQQLNWEFIGKITVKS